MTTIEQNLKWRRRASDFDLDSQKILLALSHKNWKWHTLDSLRSATRLENEEFNSALGKLLAAGLVVSSYIKENLRPIFALSERVNDRAVPNRVDSC